MWNVVIFLLTTATGNSGSEPQRFIATECYGNVLSISCKAGHRIKVLDDFFGVGTRPPGLGQCQYEPGDCTVTNSRHTSVIHRYCEGRQACNSFQVDRRFCGYNQTNYEQVEYRCIPDLEVTNMCISNSYTIHSGYIATPNFPNEYPPNLDCACTLMVNQINTRVQLEATHFIIKYDSPCKDWVEITISGQMRRLCGAYRSTLFAKSFNLTFHSDGNFGHQGLWLYFSVYPTDSNGTLLLTCERLPTTTVTTATTLTTTTSPPTTSQTFTFLQSTADVLFPQYLPTGRSIPTWDLVNTSPEARQYSRDQNNKKEVVDNPPTKVWVKEWPRGSVIGEKSSENDVNKFLETKMEERWREMVRLWLTSNRQSDWTTSQNGMQTIPNQWPIGVEQKHVHILHPDRPSKHPRRNGRGHTQEEERARNQMTGIIIISVCAGGIVLLVAILTVLLCLNKRKRPRIHSLQQQQRNERLQQRLNSLSFYDSIPLYDSLSRAPRVVAAPALPIPFAAETRNKETNERPDVRSWPTEEGQIPQTTHHHRQQLEADCKANPYWASLQLEPESDRDSAVYAELDKNSRGEHSEGLDTPSTLPRKKDGERADNAVQLQNSEEEDIYTHV